MISNSQCSSSADDACGELNTLFAAFGKTLFIDIYYLPVLVDARIA